jgi:predicted tellurium resistance membrane protein TerC
MDWLTDPQLWAGLLTLTALEIVLGIDNLLFLAILVARVEPKHQNLTRRLGLGLALGIRLVLLACISWIARLTDPVLTIADHPFSWRDAILIGGGLFLVYKGTTEIHGSMEGAEHAPQASVHRSALTSVVVQIALLDMVFSLDSVITAVGMVNHVPIMVAAVLISMAVMLLASGPASAFVERHPTVKMLVFAFLLMIGMTLVADGFGMHVPKGYIYSAIAFSAGVEMLNQLASRRRRVKRSSTPPDSPAAEPFQW